jgi:hypothetical protein
MWTWLRGLFTAESAPVATFQSGPSPALLRLLAAAESGTTSVNRAEAMSVPAVQHGRNMICSIATLPLVQVDERRHKVDNPLFTQLDPDVPNVVTLAQTIEDLVFDGIAWWEKTAVDVNRFPTAIRRRDPGQVSVHPPDGHVPTPLPSGAAPHGGTVWIDGQETPASRVIRFDSPNPGVLRVGGRPIRRAIALDEVAQLYANDPRPLDYFTPVEGADEPEDDSEILQVLSDWKTARKSRTTAYVPGWLKYNAVDAPSPQELQLVELQRQAWLELANLFGVDGEDFSISTTSRTYANAVDRRRDRINDVLSPYMRAITDRLSMGDVTPPGHLVLFDLDDYMRANPKERAEVYQTYVTMGVMTPADVRAEEGMPT